MNIMATRWIEARLIGDLFTNILITDGCIGSTLAARLTRIFVSKPVELIRLKL
jgi:hypothetical protein